jgi:FkbM family methyltransferase
MESPMTQPSYYRLTLDDRTQFEIAVDRDRYDPISATVTSGHFTFPPEFRVLLDLMRPGCTVIDLGAHIGTFALAAAALGCQVVCVEASARNVALLKASIARNGFDRVRVVAAAVSDHSGVLRFVESSGSCGYVASAGMERAESAMVEVPAITVDELVAELGWPRVDFIKMDVEGSEIAAVRGMRGLLGRADAPLVVYEANGHTLNLFGESPRRLLQSFEELGFRNYLVTDERLSAVQSGDFQPECWVDYVAARAVPQNGWGWHDLSAQTHEEVVARTIEACRHWNANHRVYTARALAESGALLSDERVILALTLLRADPDAAVRAAAAWFDPARLAPVDAQIPLEPLRAKADVVEHGYTVQSHVPIVGGLIAWVRRNLTTHLREAYVDPALERQVAFNVQVTQTLRQVLVRLAATPADGGAAQAAALEQRLATIEARLVLLSNQVELLSAQENARPDQPSLDNQLAELRAQVDDIRQQLTRP